MEFSAGSAAKPLDVSAMQIEGVRSLRTENGSVRMQVTELHRVGTGATRRA